MEIHSETPQGFLIATQLLAIAKNEIENITDFRSTRMNKNLLSIIGGLIMDLRRRLKMKTEDNCHLILKCAARSSCANPGR